MKKFALFPPAVALVSMAVFAGCAANSPAVSSGTTGAVSVSSSSSTASTSSSTQKVFTLSELKQHNGKNGSPAYIAVSGVVYDVTNVKDWSGGSHHGYSAGQDLTQAIKQAPHGTSVLKGLPVVGRLQ
ncbi:MAG: cytochrome b5 domain-containing protein [Ethanoligenens sp.]|uniref:cytochrome b5 domain-containing protein n=1 Tax=Ethanoligenens sp. TaxID=2099655 RepID=UPI0039E80F75